PMSWTPDTATAGFTTGKPFRAVSANVNRQNVQTQLGDSTSLHAYYKKLIALRRTYPSLARGSYEDARANGSVVSFKRTARSETSLVAINYGSTSANVTFAGMPPNVTASALYPRNADAAVSRSGELAIVVPERSIVVYAIRR
ncbi:MAG: DUF3459 domain-containing protein, partial [Gemmatimonadaceae bacterium]